MSHTVYEGWVNVRPNVNVLQGKCSCGAVLTGRNEIDAHKALRAPLSRSRAEDDTLDSPEPTAAQRRGMEDA